MSDKGYEFRKLNAEDIFLMVQIINKIGIAELRGLIDKDSMGKLVTEAMETKEEDNGENGSKDVSEIVTSIGVSVAFDVATIVLKNLPKCDTEIYTMLANVSNKTVEEIRKIDLDIFFDMIIEFVKKDEFKGFMQAVSKFLK